MRGGAALYWPVLIHDATGDRVGAVWAVYTSREYGRETEAAIEAGRSAGLHSAIVIDDVRRVLDSRHQY